LDLESVVGLVGEGLLGGPLELSTGCGSGESADSVKVGGLSLAEDEGSWGVVRRRVGDGVGLASNNALSRELVDLKGSDGGSEGRGGKDGLEEAHVDGSWID